MNDLRNLVTGTLPRKPKLMRSGDEALRKEQDISNEEFLEYLEQAEKDLEQGRRVWENISLLIVVAEQSYLQDPPDGPLKTLLRAHNADQGNQKDLLHLQKNLQQMKADITEEIYLDRKREVLWGISDCLIFLEEELGTKPLIRLLAKETGRKQATVQQWLLGQEPRRDAHYIIRGAAGRIYTEKFPRPIREKKLQNKK